MPTIPPENVKGAANTSPENYSPNTVFSVGARLFIGGNQTNGGIFLQFDTSGAIGPSTLSAPFGPCVVKNFRTYFQNSNPGASLTLTLSDAANGQALVIDLVAPAGFQVNTTHRIVLASTTHLNSVVKGILNGAADPDGIFTYSFEVQPV